MIHSLDLILNSNMSIVRVYRCPNKNSIKESLYIMISTCTELYSTHCTVQYSTGDRSLAPDWKLVVSFHSIPLPVSEYTYSYITSILTLCMCLSTAAANSPNELVLAESMYSIYAIDRCATQCSDTIYWLVSLHFRHRSFELRRFRYNFLRCKTRTCVAYLKFLLFYVISLA